MRNKFIITLAFLHIMVIPLYAMEQKGSGSKYPDVPYRPTLEKLLKELSLLNSDLLNKEEVKSDKDDFNKLTEHYEERIFPLANSVIFSRLLKASVLLDMNLKHYDVNKNILVFRDKYRSTIYFDILAENKNLSKVRISVKPSILGKYLTRRTIDKILVTISE